MNLTYSLNLTTVIIYALCMGFIFLYSLVQLSLIINYLRSKSRADNTAPSIQIKDLPKVTVQLPIYNEVYVVERLIDCICKFEYPINKLEIQVLDDSTDETKELIHRKVNHYQSKGFNIQHIIRPNREGYKAGALKYGVEICSGEFVAIFDSDFLPNPDFLMKTISYFKNENVGVVQTKWQYTNENYSFLTKVQAFGLNAHFSIEQVGRSFAKHFINFNGTAGVWRKSCILDAGGWQADTLTEDLDLSYRAQLKKWEFVYLENVGSPSELPVEINALKAQQFRWTKGAAECVKKNLIKVLKEKSINFKTKIHAVFHLMNSSVFLAILFLSLLSLPLILMRPLYPQFSYLFNLSSIFMISWIILALFYWTAYTHNEKNKFKRLGSFFWKFPLFLSISMGLSLHNSLAVIEGYLGRKSPFIRTPKFNIQDNSDKWESNKYTIQKVGILTYIEGLFLVYFIYTFKIALTLHDFAMIPLLLFLIVGYAVVFFSSIVHWKRATKQMQYGEVF